MLKLKNLKYLAIVMLLVSLAIWAITEAIGGLLMYEHLSQAAKDEYAKRFVSETRSQWNDTIREFNIGRKKVFIAREANLGQSSSLYREDSKLFSHKSDLGSTRTILDDEEDTKMANNIRALLANATEELRAALEATDEGDIKAHISNANVQVGMANNTLRQFAMKHDYDVAPFPCINVEMGDY